MKTLYISDLDGTLLASSAQLSPQTRDILCRLCDAGVYISAASARTAATVSKLLDGVPFRVPVILMNGACICDLQSGKYVQVQTIPESAHKELFRIMRGVSGFLFTIEHDVLHTYYERADTPHARGFMEERIRKFGKKFTKVSSFSECLGLSCVYFSVAGLETELRGLYDELAKVPDIHTEFYRDVYNTDFWYLEACSTGASKYNAAEWLRREYGFDRLIGFGDNLNDLSLFRACDESYAVSNAKDEVKRQATGVIGSNDEDAVARFISEKTGF